MPFPSFQYLYAQAKKSFLRFPWVILCGLIASTETVYLIQTRFSYQHVMPTVSIILCAALGIPLFFSIAVSSEKQAWSQKTKNLATLIVFILLIVLYFSFPDKESARNTSQPFIRYALYALSAHLMVSFIPFIGKGQLNGYWQYNKSLFLRLFLSVLYSGVLYLGIALAAFAIDQLFSFRINYTFYGQCFAVIAFLFHTWFFVGGIPNDINALEQDHEYPNGLRIFAQYVLLSLLGLYLLILYAYGTKIVLSWNWPKGIVSYLVVWVSVLGTLTFLLLYPYGKSTTYTWIDKLSKWFYAFLIPLLVLLFVAIFMRIDDYGMTENRYILLVLGIWLTMVCFFTLIGKTNIKFIPTSLAIIIVLISFGPWSIFSVGEKAQVKRLEKILSSNKILVKGKIQHQALATRDSFKLTFNTKENQFALNDSLKKEVRSILYYLNEHHGYQSIQPWFNQNLDSIIEISIKEKRKRKQFYSQSNADVYWGAMGLGSVDIIDYKEEVGIVSKNQAAGIVVSGFDIMYDVYIDNQQQEFQWGDKKIDMRFTNDSTRAILINIDSSRILLPLGDWLDKTVSNQQITSIELPQEKLIMNAENEKYQIRFVIKTMQVFKKQNRWVLENMQGKCLIRKKEIQS